MNGSDAVEIIYELTDSSGNQYKMREIIPYESYFFNKFCDAMIAAGLNEDDNLDAVIGIEEDVVLSYPDTNQLGHFTSRKPATRAPQNKSGKKGAPANKAKSNFSLEDDSDEEDDIIFDEEDTYEDIQFDDD